jgi:hypothetical protein
VASDTVDTGDMAGDHSVAVEAPSSRESEAEQVLSWRMAQLAQAGYDRQTTLLLAWETHVDLRLAVRLLERGCPIETAVRILL